MNLILCLVLLAQADTADLYRDTKVAQYRAAVYAKWRAEARYAYPAQRNMALLQREVQRQAWARQFGYWPVYGRAGRYGYYRR